MEIKWIDYKYKDKLLNLTIKDKEINGIYGHHLDDIIEILRLKEDYIGQIIINNKEITKEEIFNYKKKIEVVEEYFSLSLQGQKVEEIMVMKIKKNKVYPKNLPKKLLDSMKIVGLDQELLKRSIYTLSSSEKKLIQLVLSLLSNPDVIILKEPFMRLDIINSKKMIMILKKIRDQFHKTVVIVSNDEEILYKYTDNLIIFKNDKIVAEDNTIDLFKRVEFLKKHKVAIPQIVNFTYLARRYKNVKIDYHKDIRDIIKDIYKHV